MKTELTKKELKAITEIAIKNLFAIEERGDLETRNNDEEDFLGVAIWSLKDALIEAYKLGKNSK